MVKKAVICHPVHYDGTTSIIKNSCLLFDKILIPERAVTYHYEHATLEKPKISKEEYEQRIASINEIEFLISKGIVEPFSMSVNYDNEHFQSRLYQTLFEDAEANFRNKYPVGKGVNWLAPETLNEMNDIMMKLALWALSSRNEKGVYPILNSYQPFWKGSLKDEVLLFTLNKIPVPSQHTSWEQILEFKNDEDTRNKWYTLVHWLNTISSSNKSIDDIEDEYNYLYSEYKQAFNLHKIKSSLTTWEVLITGSIDALMLSQGFGSVIKNLFSISKTRVELKEQAMALPGREIAYIHKANETFNIK